MGEELWNQTSVPQGEEEVVKQTEVVWAKLHHSPVVSDLEGSSFPAEGGPTGGADPVGI